MNRCGIAYCFGEQNLESEIVLEDLKKEKKEVDTATEVVDHGGCSIKNVFICGKSPDYVVTEGFVPDAARMSLASIEVQMWSSLALVPSF